MTPGSGNHAVYATTNGSSFCAIKVIFGEELYPLNRFCNMKSVLFLVYIFKSFGSTSSWYAKTGKFPWLWFSYGLAHHQHTINPVSIHASYNNCRDRYSWDRVVNLSFPINDPMVPLVFEPIMTWLLKATNSGWEFWYMSNDIFLISTRSHPVIIGNNLVSYFYKYLMCQ